MTLDYALALFAAMPAADRDKILASAGLFSASAALFDCGCECCRECKKRFIAAVSAKADEIERLMLAAQKTEGKA